ncbi:MAG TPA: citrate/2-methylcitrate synthase [Trebonia sp.]|nr:citrate/2-methylcitrate synthase [Trebonia sp.]
MSHSVSAADAARRLGVKPATLYAYVSRGTLSRGRGPDGRMSLFDAEEIERLARRGRPRRPAGALDITVESQLTRITQDGLRYRGHDVAGLARTRSFEDVAELLWAGTLPAGDSPAWQALAAAVQVGRAAQAALPDGILPLERLQVIVPAMAVTDPLRARLDRPAVSATARAIIAGMIACLPPAASPGTAPEPDAAPIAERLWTRLCARRPTRAMLRALSATLVLLADHELAASTLAARTAASVRADPYAVVSAGLGVMSGAWHGGASLVVETLLAAAGDPASAPRVVGDMLRRGEKIPGFGHSVYRVADPRGRVLSDLVRRAVPNAREVAVADAVLAEVRHRALPEPNIDFALGTFTSAAGMTRGAGEAIFAVARTAGWIAHAQEAYEAGTLLRPRASYTGPAER